MNFSFGRRWQPIHPRKRTFTRLPPRVLSLLVVYAFAASIFGQTPAGSVAVSVVDSKGAAVPGASVELRTASAAVRHEITDAGGKVRFASVPAGGYNVRIRQSGFRSIDRQISVAAAGETVVDLALEVGGITETVSVTAARREISTEETAVPVSVVDRAEIVRRGLNTIGDLFRTLPGTSTVNEGAFQVRPRIRGLDSNRVLILVDGERLNNSRTSTSSGGVEIGLVETSQIDTVEVVRGSGSVLYGTDALAGTINILTRDTPPQSLDGFRVGAVLDTFYTSNQNGRRGSLAVNGAGRFFAFRVAQSLERFENYTAGNLDGRSISGVAADGEVLNSQSHGSNSQFTTRFFLNDTNTLRANYERRRAGNIGVPTLVGVFNAYFPFSNRDKVSLRYDSANLTRELTRLTLRGYYQTQYRNFTNTLTVSPVPPFFPGQYQFSETITDTKTSGFDFQTDWTLGRRNSLIAGASFFRDKNSDRRFIERRFRPFTPVLSQDRSRSVPDAALTNFAGFVQNEFSVNNRLKIVGGVRVDRFDTTSEPTTGFAIPPSFTSGQIEDLGLTGLPNGLSVQNTAVTGDLGVVFRATNNIALSARVGRSFRIPNIFERFFTDFGSIGGFVVGNPNLKPESGINFDTSIKIRTGKFAAAVTYFNNYFKDFLSTVTAFDRNGVPITIPRGNQPPIPVSQTQNIASARIQGLEFEAEAPFETTYGTFTPYGNFSYLRGDNLTTDLPLDFISPFRTYIGARWQDAKQNFYLDYYARIVGRQDRLSPSFLTSNGGPEPGFVTNNIVGGYYFRRERFNFSVNAGISNIFDRLFSEQFVTAPAGGRSFTLGTTWELK